MAERVPSTSEVKAVTSVDGRTKLVAGTCDSCSEVTFPPREYCPVCMEPQTTEVADTPVTLDTFTEIHVSSPNFETPYVAGFVRLPEYGVRAFSPLVGAATEYETGMTLEPTVVAIGELPATWAFEPAIGGH